MIITTMADEHRVTTCERCGKTCIRKFIEHVDLDGGFTSYSKYEPEPEGWKWRFEIKWLCPKCNAEYTQLLNNFMLGHVED